MTVKLLIRLAMWGTVIGLLAFAIVWGLRPQPVEVESAQVTRGPLQVAVREDGRTRIKDRYTVSAPVAGQLVRLKLRAGDMLTANATVLATIQPSDPSMLDVRQVAQAEARVASAKALIEKSEARRAQAKALLDLAEAQVGRARQLWDSKSISREDLDAAEATYRSRQEELRVSIFEQEIAKFELDQAESALIYVQPGGENRSFQFEIVAPIDGAVLRVLQESATVVAPGTPLLEIGNPADLEVVIDVLSSDAVRIKRGQKLIVDQWGGKEPLEGTVRMVEPSAFTKISALGVEEQRVNVIADFSETPQRLASLGDAYRVEGRIIVWESERVLKVPNSALFRVNGEWFVFSCQDEVAHRRKVSLGERNDRESVVLEGLSEGETVIVYPSDLLSDGSPIRVRQLPSR